jgi:hypothetical protein
MCARGLLLVLSLLTGVGAPLTLLAPRPVSSAREELVRADRADDSVWGPRTTGAAGQASWAEASCSRKVNEAPLARRQGRALASGARMRAIATHRPTYPARRALRRAPARSAADDPVA